MIITLVLDKYSDLYESYSAISHHGRKCSLVVFFRPSERIDSRTIELFMLSSGLFDFVNSLEIISIDSWKKIEKHLLPTDILIAPFIRYFDLYRLLFSSSQHNITTVHLSECLVDSFGPIGYRIGFQLNNWKSFVKIVPLAITYFFFRPDQCFYPLFPYRINPLVKKTFHASFPVYDASYINYIRSLIPIYSDTLIIGGFGIDAHALAVYHGKEKTYVATSKHKEIFVNGKLITLPSHLSAEDVLAAHNFSVIISYESSVLCWAKIIRPNAEVICYRADGLKCYSPFINIYAKSVLNALGISVKPLPSSLISKS
jgi:hypothetical protein